MSGTVQLDYNAPGHLLLAIVHFYLSHLTVFLWDVFQMATRYTDDIPIYVKKKLFIYMVFILTQQLEVPPSEVYVDTKK